MLRSSSQHQRQRASQSDTENYLLFRSGSMESGSCVRVNLRLNPRNRWLSKIRPRYSAQVAAKANLHLGWVHTRHGRSFRAQLARKSTRQCLQELNTRNDHNTARTRSGTLPRQWPKRRDTRSLRQGSCPILQSRPTEEEEYLGKIKYQSISFQ